MPNPKRRHSATRRDKRRTHYKAEAPTVVVDKHTGETHVSHQAYWLENKLMYNGQVLAEKGSN